MYGFTSLSESEKVAGQIQEVRGSLVLLAASLSELQDALVSPSVAGVVASPALLGDVARVVGALIALSEVLKGR